LGSARFASWSASRKATGSNLTAARVAGVKESCAELRVHSVSEVFGCPGRAEPDELILEDAQNG
jgi:hypothetical protein